MMVIDLIGALVAWIKFVAALTDLISETTDLC